MLWPPIASKESPTSLTYQILRGKSLKLILYFWTSFDPPYPRDQRSSLQFFEIIKGGQILIFLDIGSPLGKLWGFEVKCLLTDIVTNPVIEELGSWEFRGKRLLINVERNSLLLSILNNKSYPAYLNLSKKVSWSNSKQFVYKIHIKSSFLRLDIGMSLCFYVHISHF